MSKIESVVKGDIIVEVVDGKKRMIPVRTVEINVCSKPSVHINNNLCYDWGSDVRIVEGEGTLADLEDELKMPEEMTDEELDEELGRSLAALQDELLFESMSRLY